VLDLADLVVGKIHPLKTCRRGKVEHLSEVVRASVKLHKVLDGREGFQGGEAVIGQIDNLEINVLLYALHIIKR